MRDPQAVIYYQLEKHLPPNAVHYCFDLWSKYPFRFIISRERSSKLGDYRYEKQKGQHIITVNNNLNPYSFLITYIHEVAHLLVSLRTGKFQKPHGAEWKSQFRDLLTPMMNDLVFPEDVLDRLRKHMKNPKATTHSDPRLLRTLRRYDSGIDTTYLADIEPGYHFSFKGRSFRKEKVRRTRAVCTEIDSGKKFLISEIAEVNRLG